MNVNLLYGALDLMFWEYVLATFLMVQMTFMAVTLYLHRDATHRSVNLHPGVRHLFRFWLWMSSGIVTKEWVAVHRKHHAACETPEDPHSPQVFGLKRVLLEGAELYRHAARDQQVQAKYGRGTPDDWIERHVYTRHRNLGIVLMVTIDLFLFGAPGIIIVAIQMSANPVFGAGVINGLGHHSGYRNFECADAARNVVPWGFLVGGEELHNNHHAFPRSAKFSVRPWEFDIGWLYIRTLQMCQLAQVVRLAPTPYQRPAQMDIDLEVVRAVIVNRMHVSRAYLLKVLSPVFDDHVRKDPGLRRHVKRLLLRDPVLLNAEAHATLRDILTAHTELNTVYDFRLRMRSLCSSAKSSNERLLLQFKEWLEQAEASGIPALRTFAIGLRGYSIAPAN